MPERASEQRDPALHAAAPRDGLRGALPPAELQRFASELVEATRDHITIRPEDGLIILRPNRLNFLNETAIQMLGRLYGDRDGPDVARVVDDVCARYGVERAQVEADLTDLLRSVAALLNDDMPAAPKADAHSAGVRVTRFGTHKRELPVLSEIAVTYRCQNRCTFCYADAPKRGRDMGEMTTDEVCRIIDIIYEDAKCPTVSFTGGEPTLREDLAQLVGYAKSKGADGTGMRVNLITNGVRCADLAYVRGLADAGLDSAQVSIEGGSFEIHDAITQHPGSFERSVQGVRNLRACGVHTHTNTTICGGNRQHLMALVDFVADDLQSEYFSMNMVIRTGTALDHAEDDVRYDEIGDIVLRVQERATAKGVRFVWYSPVPYCMFNPVQAGLGSKSCACADGLISVNPAGELLPCSSFERGIGDLLHEPFEKVWYSRTARYWRGKQFLPPACARCSIRDICCGACPLYWEQRKSFGELSGFAPATGTAENFIRGVQWHARRALWSGSWGVGLGDTWRHSRARRAKE